MSLVVSVYVREGIVMAADSRLTLNTEARQPDKTVVNLAVGQSDSNYKLFLAPGNVGISTYGAADIAGVPIAGYVESLSRSPENYYSTSRRSPRCRKLNIMSRAIKKLVIKLSSKCGT